MTEFIDFPTLTGAALGQTVGFFFGRLSALLDRRRASNEKIEAREVPDVPEVFEGELGPFQVDEALVEQRADELASLANALGVYNDHPEILRADDSRLFRNLAQARSLLEEVYGQYFTLKGEKRPESGVRIDQDIKRVAGEVIGLDADGFGRKASAEVSQKVEDSQPGSSVIGARIKRLG